MSHRDLPKPVQEHAQRVAKLARLAARATGKDEHRAYLAGFFHDSGKELLPAELFSDKDVTEAEYALIQEHAVAGYKKLKDHMLFSGLCAGLHHRMGTGSGYGISLEDIPDTLTFSELKKLLDISTIVSIGDYIDASLTRSSHVHGKGDVPLEEQLLNRYPAESVLIRIMLGLSETLYNRKEVPDASVKDSGSVQAGMRELQEMHLREA